MNFSVRTFIVGVCLIVSAQLTVMAYGSKETSSAATASMSQPLVLHGMANQYQYAPTKTSDFWVAMEKKFDVNYTVDWVPADSYNQKVNIVIASGDLPDIMQIQAINSPPSVLLGIKNGAFKDLTPFLGDFSKYPYLGKLNPTAWQLSKVDGKNYFVPRTRGNLDSALFIRGDWLKKYGMKVPTSLAEYADYLELVASKNLAPIGIAPQDTTFGTEGFFSSAFGTKDPVYTSDGGIIQKYLTSNYADYVEWIRGLYAKGYAAKEYALILDSKQNQLFTTGQLASYIKNSWHRKDLTDKLQATVPEGVATLVPYLDGPKGFAHIWDLGYFGGQVVNAKLADSKVERILKFFNDTSNPAEYNFVNFGIEGVDWVLKDGFPSLTDKGKQEVTASFNAPFIFATNTYAKVDSPLASAAYNRDTRTQMEVLNKKGGKVDPFQALQSDSWTTFWARTKDEFVSEQTDAVTGKITMDQFRSYQASLLKDPDVIRSEAEFATSYAQIFGSK